MFNRHDNFLDCVNVKQRFYSEHGIKIWKVFIDTIIALAVVCWWQITALCLSSQTGCKHVASQC